MRDDIILKNKKYSLSRRDRKRLIEQLKRMEHITEVGKAALEHQSDLFLSALLWISKTLEKADKKVWNYSKGRLSAEDEEILRHLTWAYLVRMQEIFEISSQAILRDIANIDSELFNDHRAGTVLFPLLED